MAEDGDSVMRWLAEKAAIAAATIGGLYAVQHLGTDLPSHSSPGLIPDKAETQVVKSRDMDMDR